jgi:hypothetical protein
LTPAPTSWHRNGLQRELRHGYFCGGRCIQEIPQRHTMTDDYYQPLHPFAPLGCADTGPPDFAGAKHPSAKASDQSHVPWAWCWPKKARQALRPTSYYSLLLTTPYCLLLPTAQALPTDPRIISTGYVYSLRGILL